MFTLPAIAQKQYIVDEHAVMRNLEGQFNSVQVAGDVKVYITQSDQFAIAVSTAGKAEDILTTITGNSLLISRSGSGSWNKRRNEAVVYVAMPVIEKIMLSGASTIKMIGNIKADNLELLLSGASELSGTVQADNLVMNLSGASDAYLSGVVNQLTVACSGASDVRVTDSKSIFARPGPQVRPTYYLPFISNFRPMPAGPVRYFSKGRLSYNHTMLKGQAPFPERRTK